VYIYVTLLQVKKLSFGTASLADLNQLHGTLDELKSKEADIVHLLANQLTYLKGLGRNTQLNSEAVSNMSTIVKKELVQLHDRYVQLTRDVMWLISASFNQSALFTVIRELEYALLQLNRQEDQLLTAVHLMLSGKLPLSLISPHVLHNILISPYAYPRITNSLPVPSLIASTSIIN
jgi:hypothetical protein